jgi:hypothetical protein
MTERKLVKKLTEVMDQVKYIQKKGFNKFHKYSYATESDVSERVREELAKRVVMMIPNVVESTVREHKNRSNNIEYIVKVRMEFKFIDGETGEELVFHSEGEGQDAGDKGIYKAITGAQKYALMKAFMIPTGDDPEADSGVDERNTKEEMISSEQVGKIKVLAKTLAKHHGLNEQEMYQKILNTSGRVDITQLSKQQANTLITRLEEGNKKIEEPVAQ